MRHAKQRRAESEAALAAEFEPYGAPPGGPPNAGMASTQSGPFMAWPAQLLSAGARPDSRRSSSICYPERKHASASAAAKSKFETWSDVEAPYSAKNATAALPSSQQLPPMSPMEHALLHTSSADTLPHLPVLTKPEPAQARHGSQHHSLPAAAVHGQPEVSVSPASGNKTTFSEKSCAHNTDKRWDGISYLVSVRLSSHAPCHNCNRPGPRLTERFGKQDYKFSGNPQSPPPIAVSGEQASLVEIQNADRTSLPR